MGSCDYQRDGELQYHLGSGVLNFHSLDDGGSVVGDDDVPARGHDLTRASFIQLGAVVHVGRLGSYHFIHAFWAQAGAHSVRDGTRGGDVALAD